MKKKELKIVASMIADAEKIISNSKDQDEIRNAKEKVMKLSNRITSMEDMLVLDDLIQEYLKNS